MTCLHCKNIDLQSHRKMSALGFGLCSKDSSRGSFMPLIRTCGKFERTSDDVIEKREVWFKAQSTKGAA